MFEINLEGRTSSKKSEIITPTLYETSTSLKLPPPTPPPPPRENDVTDKPLPKDLDIRDTPVKSPESLLLAVSSKRRGRALPSVLKSKDWGRLLSVATSPTLDPSPYPSPSTSSCTNGSSVIALPLLLPISFPSNAFPASNKPGLNARFRLAFSTFWEFSFKTALRLSN